MQVTVESFPKKFEPIRLSLVIETPEELGELLARINLSTTAIANGNAGAKTSTLIGKWCVDYNSYLNPLWRVLKSIAEQGGYSV